MDSVEIRYTGVIKRTISVLVAILICVGFGASAFSDVIQVPSPVEIQPESVGVWQLPKLHTSTPLYIKREGKTPQDIVDARNSAHLTRYGIGQTISDHYGSRIGNGNDRWVLEEINVDDIAWLIEDGKITKYQCYLVCVADVCGSYFKINGTTLLPYYPYDIICRCCVHKDTERNYLAFFRCLGEWG